MSHSPDPSTRYRGIPQYGKYFSKNTEAFSEKKQEEFCNDFFTLGITQYVLEWAENDFREPVEDIIAHLSWLLQKVYV